MLLRLRFSAPLLLFSLYFVLPGNSRAQRNFFSPSELVHICKVDDAMLLLENAGYDHWPKYSDDSTDFFMQPMISDLESAKLTKQKTPVNGNYSYLVYSVPKQFNYQVEWFNAFNKALTDSGFVYKSHTDTSAYFASKDSVNHLFISLSRAKSYQTVTVRVLQVFYIVNELSNFQISELEDMLNNYYRYKSEAFMYKKRLKKNGTETYVQTTTRGEAVKVFWHTPDAEGDTPSLNLTFSSSKDFNNYKSRFIEQGYKLSAEPGRENTEKYVKGKIRVVMEEKIKRIAIF